MRLLDRYLLRELLVPLGYCLGGFLIFWVACDLIAELDEFSGRLKGAEIAFYYALRLPEFTVLIGPMALLLSLLYALTNHARHHELTAIRAAGVGMWRMCLPYLMVGFVGSLLLTVLNEGLVPYCSALADQLRARPVDGSNPTASAWVKNLNFHNARENRYWAIQEYNTDTGEMRRPRVIWVLMDGARRDLSAETALYFNHTWTFYNVQELTYTGRPGALPVPNQTNELSLPMLTETPDQIKSEIKVSGTSDTLMARKVRLTTREIFDYLRLHPRLAVRDHARLYTQLHVRLAAPWTALIVVLVAIPFGAASGRRNVFVAVASSIFIVFAFFVLQQAGMVFGTGGYLRPEIAGWGPNVLFGLVGLVLTSRVR